jgi:hypothetical protein
MSAPAKANTVPHTWRKLCVQLAHDAHKPWWYAGLCQEGAGAGHFDPKPVVYTPPEDCWPFPGKKHHHKKWHKKWDKKWEKKWDFKHGKKDYKKKGHEYGDKFWKAGGKKHDRKHTDFKFGDFGKHHKDYGKKDYGKKDWGKIGSIFSDHGKSHPFSPGGKPGFGKSGAGFGKFGGTGGHQGERHLSLGKFGNGGQGFSLGNHDGPRNWSKGSYQGKSLGGPSGKGFDAPGHGHKNFRGHDGDNDKSFGPQGT